MMKYYAIHTHLHCSHEPTASIGSHMSRCKALGIDYLWTTEHDTRISDWKNNITRFAFLKNELSFSLDCDIRAGFSEEAGSNGSYEFIQTDSGFDLLISAGVGKRESLLFSSRGKKHCSPLFSQLTVVLEAEIQGEVGVEFVLSAQPPSYRLAKLCYGAALQREEGAPVAYMPLPKNSNGKYVFPLFKDAVQEIGGLDNALCNIRFCVQNGGTMRFHSLSFLRELHGEAVRQAQAKVAKSLGKKWGVTAFVGFEITGAGNHKNCFSTQIPVIDYSKSGYQVSNEDAIAYLKKYGAVYSWNHPFTQSIPSEKSKEEIFEEIAETLVKNRVYGASVIEVGFPCGRDNFSAKDYLRLWDRLSENGIKITGNGDSDNHHAVEEGWTQGNNFCTFAGLYDNEEPTEENFVIAFRRGSVWSGNPVLIKNLSFSSGEKPQGSVFYGKCIPVSLSASQIQCEGYAVLVVNGAEVDRCPIQDGAVSKQWSLSCEKKYNFARIELYDAQNLLIAFSNPIYLFKNKKNGAGNENF